MLRDSRTTRHELLSGAMTFHFRSTIPLLLALCNTSVIKVITNNLIRTDPDFGVNFPFNMSLLFTNLLQSIRKHMAGTIIAYQNYTFNYKNYHMYL